MTITPTSNGTVYDNTTQVITITITGPPATGKTTLRQMLRSTLTDNNILFNDHAELNKIIIPSAAILALHSKPLTKAVLLSYEIHLTTGKSIVFTGRYRRDLETTNWHYYEKADGSIIHFRKEHIVYVEEDTIEDIN